MRSQGSTLIFCSCNTTVHPVQFTVQKKSTKPTRNRVVCQKAEIEVIELKSQWELFMDLLNKNNNTHFNFTTHFNYLLAVSWSKATKALSCTHLWIGLTWWTTSKNCKNVGTKPLACDVAAKLLRWLNLCPNANHSFSTKTLNPSRVR